DTVHTAKDHRRKSLQQDKAQSSAFAQKNAASLAESIVELHDGDLDQEESNERIEAQRAAAAKFVNTQAITGQARARELTLPVLDIAVKKIAPVVIAAI